MAEDEREGEGAGTIRQARRRSARQKKVWRRIRRTCYVLLALGVLLPVSAFAVGYLIWEVRSPQEVLAEQDKTVILQYSDGTELSKIVPEDGDRSFVRYADVPRKLRDAIIAVEDPSFWSNQGFDPMGIARALVTGVGGGSGITQQYIKKSTGNDEGSYERKFKELVLAAKITQQQSKEQIFESYVNIISFGRNTHGPAAAMNAYFGKPLGPDLTWSEAAFLAGMIQAPSVHDPAASGDEHAEKRWDYVVNKLTSRGYVSPAERAGMTYPGKSVLTPAETRAGRGSYTDFHLKRQVLAELEGHGFTLDRLRRGGMRIVTTIDRRAQQLSEQALRDRLTGQPDHFRAALVSLEPGTGRVLAYQGGRWGVRDYAATPHPPGSAFHPFVTVAGLLQRSGLDATFPAPEKAEFGGETFKNETDCARTDFCSVREATQVGADTPFVEMTRRFGARKVSDAAHEAGIPIDRDGKPTLRDADGVTIGPGIAVGRYPVRTLDLLSAYATFADGGVRTTPRFVSKVVNERGDVEWAPEPDRVPAFGPEIADRVTESLRPVPGGKELSDGRPAAAKAGSHRFPGTGDNAAAWMVGYTPQVATAVWVGADEERRLRDAANARVTGQTVPGDIWRTFMDAYHQGLEVRAFPGAPPAVTVAPPQLRAAPPTG
ncbi:transglycosylase domain-containing protein [Amycolatopsis anabasis]|uniref:transglycosylase domain-containing protein n=1 Tax=Amycolatopsis anabasis TaxID=1840409 RepID=UPI001FEAB210|nr:transglycosylase domain-containing protein [Amycolatopsis anabasis]